MLLTPEYFKKLGYTPIKDNEFIIAFELEKMLFIRWSKKQSNLLDIGFRGAELIVDYKNNYKVGEFKSLCEGLRIPLKSINEPSNRISEYGC